jgi:hypothetical protein
MLYRAIYHVELLFDCDCDTEAESRAADIAYGIAEASEDNDMDVAELRWHTELIECEVLNDEEEEI